MIRIDELSTPALVVDGDVLERNLTEMATRHPGAALRPHVKAHKCSKLAARQRAHGHHHFTCATAREMMGLAQAGLGEDLLLANELVDPARLAALAGLDARVTLAIDSDATLSAAARAGIREVLVDVNVGLPRCGCAPEEAGRIAEAARAAGLSVRGVMGYEGHLMAVEDAVARATACAESMEHLSRAHRDVGGEIISAGGTGTYADNRVATEIQAGSYALMDTAYAKLGLPFEHALWIQATVISVSDAFAVADCGLKSLGMDHGNSRVEGGKVWFFSDEHVTFAPEHPVAVGDRIRVLPAHIDPTVAYHEEMVVVQQGNVVDRWPVDLRGW